jgi:hypothetical protein
MVNSYVSMKGYCELIGVPVLWTHHDWNKAIGYTHLDRIKYWPRRKEPHKNNDITGPAKQQEGPKVGQHVPLANLGSSQVLS